MEVILSKWRTNWIRSRIFNFSRCRVRSRRLLRWSKQGLWDGSDV